MYKINTAAEFDGWKERLTEALVRRRREDAFTRPGQDAEPAIRYELANYPDTKAIVDEVDPLGEHIVGAIAETGGWAREELTDPEMNVVRFLWILMCNYREEQQELEREEIREGRRFSQERLREVSAQHNMDGGGYEFENTDLDLFKDLHAMVWELPALDYFIGEGKADVLFFAPGYSHDEDEWPKKYRTENQEDECQYVRTSLGAIFDGETECNCHGRLDPDGEGPGKLAWHYTGSFTDAPNPKCERCGGDGYLNRDGGSYALYDEKEYAFPVRAAIETKFKVSPAAGDEPARIMSAGTYEGTTVWTPALHQLFEIYAEDEHTVFDDAAGTYVTTMKLAELAPIDRDALVEEYPEMDASGTYTVTVRMIRGQTSQPYATSVSATRLK